MVFLTSHTTGSYTTGPKRRCFTPNLHRAHYGTSETKQVPAVTKEQLASVHSRSCQRRCQFAQPRAAQLQGSLGLPGFEFPLGSFSQTFAVCPRLHPSDEIPEHGYGWESGVHVKATSFDERL